MVDSPRVRAILNEIAEKEIVSPKTSIQFHERRKEGEGYMGDLYFITIREQGSSNKVLELVMKRAKQEKIVRDTFPLEKIYSNECFFYKTIWPILEEFQDVTKCRRFDKIPKCYGTDMDKDKYCLILENLKAQNFKVIERGTFFDKEHFELIFREYGKFHGVSMAFRDKFPMSYKALSSKLPLYWIDPEYKKVWQRGVTFMVYQFGDVLSKDFELQDYESHIDEVCEIVTNVHAYHGIHTAFLHGEPSPGNIMFKYDENNKPIDLRLIDFQYTRVGTPVHDLSYCLYSGGSKEMYNELGLFLEIYYKSLAETLRDFDCNPDRVYPFYILLNDWKRYSIFGFTMGLFAIREHMVPEHERLDITQMIAEIETMTAKEVEGYCTKEVREKTMDLIKHVKDAGFI